MKTLALIASTLVLTLGCGGDGGGGGGGPDGGVIAPMTGPYFPNGSVFYADVSGAALDPDSADIIGWLDDAGGWGAGNEMRMDLTIHVLTADGDAPVREFVPTDEHWIPDCDVDPVPIPAGGAVEDNDGYGCDTDGDCHLIVVHTPAQKLYEMWRANLQGDSFAGGCLAVWDLTRVYGDHGRGLDCTSADAAGLPIAPLLFTADELAAGEVGHAIRFILPNERIRAETYVAPATHSTSATGGDALAPAYGARLRLRADYPVDGLPSEGARVIARAMQKYGMFLADGGNIALTGAADRFATASYDGLLAPDDLTDLAVTDFEVLDSGPALAYDDDCTRE